MINTQRQTFQHGWIVRKPAARALMHGFFAGGREM